MGLGLKTLDEPAPVQSDPTVLSMQIRSISKMSNLQPIQVTSLQPDEQTPQRIGNWIDSLAELHKSKPPPGADVLEADARDRDPDGGVARRPAGSPEEIPAARRPAGRPHAGVHQHHLRHPRSSGVLQ